MSNEFFNKLIASAKEAVEIEKGNLKPARVTTYTLSEIEAIRAKAKLKQKESK